MKETSDMFISDSVKYTVPLKQSIQETSMISLHDPIDREFLCEKIAELIDSALVDLQNSANDNGVEIIQTRVSFMLDTEDLHRQFGYFRVIATGKDKEGAK